MAAPPPPAPSVASVPHHVGLDALRQLPGPPAAKLVGAGPGLSAGACCTAAGAQPQAGQSAFSRQFDEQLALVPMVRPTPLMAAPHGGWATSAAPPPASCGASAGAPAWWDGEAEAAAPSLWAGEVLPGPASRFVCVPCSAAPPALAPGLAAASSSDWAALSACAGSSASSGWPDSAASSAKAAGLLDASSSASYSGSFSLPATPPAAPLPAGKSELEALDQAISKQLAHLLQLRAARTGQPGAPASSAVLALGPAAPAPAAEPAAGLSARHSFAAQAAMRFAADCLLGPAAPPAAELPQQHLVTPAAALQQQQQQPPPQQQQQQRAPLQPLAPGVQAQLLEAMLCGTCLPAPPSAYL